MLLDGINHVALLTEDTDRLIEFYTEVFDATVSGSQEIPPGKLTFIDIGPKTELNVFELKEKPAGLTRGSMFGHGPIDHMGLQAANKSAFDEIRRRLMARGATDGFVTDFGASYSLFFVDPDGLELEVLLFLERGLPGNPPGTPAPGYEVGK
jgi:catechol 2,3-dioxygenase-like lactoylglutathione lyase family enzyme